MGKAKLEIVREKPLFEDIVLEAPFDRAAWDRKWNPEDKNNQNPGTWLRLTSEEFLFPDMTERAHDSAALLHTRIREALRIEAEIDRLKLELKDIWERLDYEGYSEAAIRHSKALVKAARTNDWVEDALTDAKLELQTFANLTKILRFDERSEALRDQARRKEALESTERDFAAMKEAR